MTTGDGEGRTAAVPVGGDQQLGWWRSVRLAGLRGGRAATLDLKVALWALRSGLRGQRRIDAVGGRVATLLGEVDATQRTDGEAGGPAQLQRLLAEVVTVVLPDGPGPGLAAVVARLARQVAYGPLLTQAVEWLKDDAELIELQRHIGGRPTLAFLDLEASPTHGIDEAAVAVRCPVRGRLFARDWAGGLDAAELSRILEGTVPVAHNGDAHDLPLLKRAGVVLPPSSIDTLHWAQLADPMAPSHGQLPLIDAWNLEVVGQAHTAKGDVEALQTLFEAVKQRLCAVAVEQRRAIAAALHGVVHDTVVVEMLQVPLPADPAGHGWQPEVTSREIPVGDELWARGSLGSSVAGERIVREARCERVEPGQTLLVRRLSDAVQDGLIRPEQLPPSASAEVPLPAVCWRVLGHRCLDAQRVAGLVPGGGWPVALAIRLLAVAGGLIDLASPGVGEQLTAVPRRRAALVEVGSGSVRVTDAAAMSLSEGDDAEVVVPRTLDLLRWPAAVIEVPTTATLDELAGDQQPTIVVGELPVAERDAVLAAVRGLLPGVSEELLTAGRLVLHPVTQRWRFAPPPIDPARLSGRLIGHGAGVSWARQELRSLLRGLLGAAPSTQGAAGPFTCEVSSVQDPPPRGTLRRPVRLRAGMAALAAVGADGEHPAMLLSPEVSGGLPSGLPALWRERLGGPLLRPPDWPTRAETVARLQRAESWVASDFLTGSSLLRAVPDRPARVVVDGLPRTDLSSPLVVRLLLEATEAFSEVIEPVAALHLLELLGQGPSRVVLIDPIATTSPLLQAVTRFGVTWRSVRLDDVTDGPHRDAIDAACATTQTPPGTLVSEPDLSAAVRRLLPEGGTVRRFQTTVLDDLRACHDVLAVFRTGLGKSLCYQAPALALSEAEDGVSLVVSPLMALQANQLAGLHARGVWQATLINSALSPEVRSARLRGLRAGFYRIVLCAPEALVGARLRGVLRELPVRLLAIDEAHVISELGHDFRPDFRLLPGILRGLVGLRHGESFDGHDRPVVLALTGTASPDVRDDITRLLDLPLRTHVDGTFVRDELRFCVWNLDVRPTTPPNSWPLAAPTDPAEPRTDGPPPAHDTAGTPGPVVTGLPVPGDDHARLRALLSCLDAVGRPAIVYTPTRPATEQLAALIASLRPDERTAAYHAGIDDRAPGERTRIEMAFLAGEIDVLTATNAFGMGVDKGDVRAVVHWATPATPEALYQEAGRAGRALPAGEQAWCVMLHRDVDLQAAGRMRDRERVTYTDLQQTWASLEAIDALQAPAVTAGAARTHRDVLVADDDLEVAAGLVSSSRVRTVLAHLERAGLLSELERGVMGAHLRVVSDMPTDPAVLSDLERELLQVLPAPGSTATVRLDALLAQLPITATLDVGTAFVALRGLQRHGAVTIERQIGILPQATDLVAETERTWQMVRAVGHWLHKADWFGQRRWGPLQAGDVGLDLPDLLRAVEVLTARGCLRVSRATRHLATLRVQHGPKELTSLQPLSENLPAVAAVLPSEPQRLGLHHLADRAALPSTTTLDVLTALHLLGVIQLDAAGWQFDPGTPRRTGSGRNGRRRGTATFRQLRLAELRDDEVEGRLRAAHDSSRLRAREDELKRTALLRYAELPEDDEADVKPRQRYLEAYFTERRFLADLLASETGQLLDGLDPDQVAAVTADDQTVRIVAGPGTGKTHTLTRRIAYRLTAGRADGATTIALAYNRAAAAQLAARLAGLGVTSVRPSTVHALALRIVLAHYRLVGYRDEPRIVTGAARTRLLPRAWRANAATKLDIIDRICSAGLDLSDLATSWHRLRVKAPYEPAIVQHVQAYRDAMIAANAMDHAHSILFASAIAADDNDGARLRRSIEEVFIDEVQDIAPSEMTLVINLARDARLTVVGDQRQAIYLYKLADPALMGPWLDQQRPAVAELELTYNYRSRPAIVDAANRLSKDIAPGLRPLQPTRSGRTRILTFPEATATASFDTVTERVRHHLAAGVPDNQIVVLARSNDSVTNLSSHLAGQGLNVRTAGLAPLRDTRAYKLLHDNIEHVQTAADERYAALLASTHHLDDLEDTADDNRPSAPPTDVAEPDLAEREAPEQATSEEDTSDEASRPDQARVLAEGLETFLRSEPVESQLAGIDEAATEVNRNDRDRLIATLHEYVDDGNTSLPALLKKIRHARDDDDDSKANGVTISTVHKAKGLEWDVVLIAEATSKNWYGGDHSDELERLFYVAATRARNALEVHWGGGQPYVGISTIEPAPPPSSGR